MHIYRESRWPRLGLLTKYFLRGSGLIGLMSRTAGRGCQDGASALHCLMFPCEVARHQGTVPGLEATGKEQ